MRRDPASLLRAFSLLFLAFFLSASCILKTQSHIGQRQTSAPKNYGSLILSQKSKGQTKDDKHSKEVLVLFSVKQCCRGLGCATQIENNTLTHMGGHSPTAAPYTGSCGALRDASPKNHPHNTSRPSPATSSISLLFSP